MDRRRKLTRAVTPTAPGTAETCVARRQLQIIVALTALVAIGGCAAGSGPSDGEAACRARGLLPGTAEFAVCLHPNEATAVERGEEAWEQMQSNGEE